jgi:predicted RNase H-like HicB family nuclease
MKKPFYTAVLRPYRNLWVGLCLENGASAQGESRDQTLGKLQEAIASLEEARAEDPAIYTAPVAIQELHEFLAFETDAPSTEPYELRAVYA